LEANGYRFGLCRRYENEWWHFEPLVAPGTQCPALEEYPVAK
jgi:D-alanyl-D-alanine dipeptidase